MSDLPKRTIIVREIKPLSTTRSPHGTEGTLYEVFAVKADGEQITEKLRTFEDLPLDEEIEVTLKRYDHAKYGVSYTLKRVREGKSGGGGLKDSVDALRQEFNELRDRVSRLESRLPGGAEEPAAAPAEEAPRV